MDNLKVCVYDIVTTHDLRLMCMFVDTQLYPHHGHDYRLNKRQFDETILIQLSGKIKIPYTP